MNFRNPSPKTYFTLLVGTICVLVLISVYNLVAVKFKPENSPKTEPVAVPAQSTIKVVESASIDPYNSGTRVCVVEVRGFTYVVVYSPGGNSICKEAR